MSTSWTSVNLDLNAAFTITDQLSNITRGMSYPSVLFVAELESFETRDVNFQELFSPVENLNSRELVRVSVGTSALPTPIPRKITVGVAWSCVQAWLLRRVAISWSRLPTA